MIELKTTEEIEKAWQEAGNGWLDPEIPRKQYEMVVKNELEKYKQGASIAPYDAFIRTLLTLPPEIDGPQTTLLDVGASGGYYREIMRTAGFKYDYTGCDWNKSFRNLAIELYRDMKYDIGDARALPYQSDSFDIVVSGCCMLHVKDYKSIIKEAARVSKKYVIFHRQPVLFRKETTYYKKEAYGVPCVEIHFSEREFMMLLTLEGLALKHFETVFYQAEEDYAHITYLCEKVQA